MLSIYELIKLVVLLVNALGILNEKRFLSLYGWDKPMHESDQSVKAKIIGLLYGVRLVLQIPLIVANAGCILIELVFG